MKDAFARAETLRFIGAHTRPGARILDAGAGRGALAALLRAQGFDVTAIDRSEKSVAAAAAAGIEVTLADLRNDVPGPPFDTIVLSMVAHHLNPLAPTLARLTSRLAPGGALLIEDFGVDLVDADAAHWFYERRVALGGPPTSGSETAPLALWNAEHFADPPLHSSVTLMAAADPLGATVERVPYLYRYLSATAGDTHWTPSLGERLFAEEGARFRFSGLRLIVRR